MKKIINFIAYILLGVIAGLLIAAFVVTVLNLTSESLNVQDDVTFIESYIDILRSMIGK